MAKKILSIVIGDEITKVCEISYNKYYKNNGIRVHHSISFPTPVNMIEDGFIKNKNIFAEYLQEQLKASGITTKKAIFSIASSKIANREVIIPLVDEKKIMSIIKTGASDYFPVDIKDYILSYIILEKKTSDREGQNLAKKQARLDKKIAKEKAKQEKLNEFNELEEDTPRQSEDTPRQSEASVRQNEMLGSQPTTKQEDKDKQGKRQIRLSVYAAPANLVKNYYNFADLVGLEVVSIDYSGNSSYQMLKRQANQGTNVFIQLNDQDTVISILRDNVLILQRTIGYGISSLIDTVMDQKCYGISSKEDAIKLLSNRNLLNSKSSDPITNNLSTALDEVAATIDNPEVLRQRTLAHEEYMANRSIVESLIFLTNSISRMLDYYKNNHRNVIFQSIYLSGLGTRIMGIDQFFSDAIGINNMKLDKLLTVSATKEAEAYLANPSEFMACVGSIINPVDFVPLELLERKQRVQNIIASAVLITVCIGAAGALCLVSYGDYLSAKKEYRKLENQLEAMPSTSGIKTEYEYASLRISELEKLEEAMQGDQRINDVLAELQAKLLTNASVQSIQFSETGVVMNIIMADHNFGANTLVAKLLLQLKTIELFSEIQDSNMAVAEDGQVSLTVSCTYR